ncbi:MAG TPA: hypothetical protein VK338_03450 [Candidatus Nitrosocosmicus sp.]|nr:hypothetical protein [Candidatus Nitrosocosmicus sp.]
MDTNQNLNSTATTNNAKRIQYSLLPVFLVVFLLGIGVGYLLFSNKSTIPTPTSENKTESTSTPIPTITVEQSIYTEPTIVQKNIQPTQPSQKTKRELDDEFYACVSNPNQAVVAQECEAKVGTDPTTKQQCITQHNNEKNKECQKQVYGQ